ncbi:hypothetical protein AB4205_12980 [Vibrio sp. 10N.286.49.F3]|uniref:hypothetical protein n=1 Tax=Vibrio sp. 10N.286.49.F3 TaxID=3229704 RepID=UPI00354F5D9D
MKKLDLVTILLFFCAGVIFILCSFFDNPINFLVYLASLIISYFTMQIINVKDRDKITSLLSILFLFPIIALPLQYSGIVASIHDYDGLTFRFISTFGGPNTSGIIHGMAILFFIKCHARYREKKYLIIIAISFVSLMATFSLSSILSFSILLLISLKAKESFKLIISFTLVFVVFFIFKTESIWGLINIQLDKISVVADILMLEDPQDSGSIGGRVIQIHHFFYSLNATSLFTGWGIGYENFYMQLISISGVMGFMLYFIILSRIFDVKNNPYIQLLLLASLFTPALDSIVVLFFCSVFTKLSDQISNYE